MIRRDQGFAIAGAVVAEILSFRGSAAVFTYVTRSRELAQVGSRQIRPVSCGTWQGAQAA